MVGRESGDLGACVQSTGEACGWKDLGVQGAVNPSGLSRGKE